MKPKTLVVLMSIMLASNIFTSLVYIENCKGDVLPKFYVDDNYGSSTPGWQVDHFNKIQDAIDASSDEDRILVYAGVYSETITINHKIDLFGEDKSTVIINGANSGDRITITASNVNICHFSIRNCGNGATNAVIFINSGNTLITDNIIESGNKHGIYINNCNSNIVYDNTIRNNAGNGIYFNNSNTNDITYNSITSNSNEGLFLYNSSDNIIQNNAAIQSNSYNGIFLNETSNDNTILDNNITSNTKNGIFLNDHCDDNTVSSNDIYNNKDSGIRQENSSSNIISSCNIDSNNDYGVMIVGSNNTIQNNTIRNNGIHGIFLFADDNNNLSSNIINGNTYDGIRLSNSTSDSIYKNEIFDNFRYGMNLDYFTMNNLIYDNYFHDNTDNAVDKSINHNIWNITKTAANNKVGGSYQCGNYWDDYDEVGEGAIDSNGDGLADDAYTIYGSNNDYGAILDITNPTIGLPQANPSVQTLGGYTYLSFTITDNTEIKEVDLYISNPNNQTTNFSILQNKTGNTYFCNKKYTIVGTYTFYVKAKDPRNWTTSSSNTFDIHEGTAPTITDNTPTTGYASKTFVFKAIVIDDMDDVSQLTVKVEWTHGNLGGNDTLININNNNFEKSVLLDNKILSLSYTIYACDKWGNSRTTTVKTVSVIDNEAPIISINSYGPSPEILPNSFTFNAKVTDNTEVEEVTIEYWYEDSDHMTVEMDSKSYNNYEKIIVIDENPDRVYCIIYATDIHDNHNDTKKPFANSGGPYKSVIGTKLTFDATNSFDLDGDIVSYSWNFGDGTLGVGATAIHIYTTNGNYPITLTVTDNNGNTDVDITNAVIISSTQRKTSYTTMNEIEDQYGVTLYDLFYVYDSDGDSIVDIFVDPNYVLTPVHSGNININGDIVFLLSIDDSGIPDFIWNSTTDKIIDIDHTIGSMSATSIDNVNNIANVLVITEKIEGWIYLEVEDPDLLDGYIISDVISISRNYIEIDDDKIFRNNKKTYVLDDPEVEYQFIYSITPPVLGPAEFTPKSGGTIDKNNPTITIRYYVLVDVILAEIYRLDPITHIPNASSGIDITNNLVTKDDKIFTYTPPPNLIDGEYQINIVVREKDGIKIVESFANYLYHPYIVQEMEVSIFSILIILGIIGGAAFLFYLIFRFKNISFESFIYFKNKKIIPFFKPMIIGPLKIDVDDEKVKKAEFYVNGKLKESITKSPYIWHWDEPAFLKKTIETKIYDEEGKSNTSGEMTFFVFNYPKLFK